MTVHGTNVINSLYLKFYYAYVSDLVYLERVLLLLYKWFIIILKALLYLSKGFLVS